jgi:hypothetical protein
VNARLLAVGLTVTLVGMACLSRVSTDTSYLTGVPLPRLLIGAGLGGSLAVGTGMLAGALALVLALVVRTRPSTTTAL